MAELDGKRVAFLATNGFEDSELTGPWQAVTGAGARAVLVSPEEGTITGKNGTEVPVDLSVADARAEDFDALVLPGGVQNGDQLRLDDQAVVLVGGFFAQRLPVGVICHGGWILSDADVVRGRRMTSYPSLRTDLTNAGADWVDEEVVVDRGLVSSRIPDDLPAFNSALLDAIEHGSAATGPE